MSKCTHPKCERKGNILDNKYCSSLCYVDDLESQLAEAKNKLNEIESVCNGYKAMQSEYATSTEIPYWDIMNIIEGYNKGERR